MRFDALVVFQGFPKRLLNNSKRLPHWTGKDERAEIPFAIGSGKEHSRAEPLECQKSRPAS